MTGSVGVSSTPRLLNSIVGVSGILDRPLFAAMTIERESGAFVFIEYVSAFPRRVAPELCTNRSPKKNEGVGMPGARRTRSLVCKVESTRVVTTGPPEQPGIPTRNGFNGFLRALPGDRAFLSPSPADCSADLTPASRRQDHTTWPSAKLVLSSAEPPASTASHPASVTIAIRPS